MPQLFNIDRVEVFKGPAAALYGAGEPRRDDQLRDEEAHLRPHAESCAHSRQLLALWRACRRDRRADGQRRLSTGAIHEAQDSFRDNADEKNIEIGTGLLFSLGQDTDLTFNLVDQQLGGHRLRGVHANDAGGFIVSRSYNTNESSDFQDL